MKNAVISLSGGLDSTCCLLHLLSQGYGKIKAYTFKYGQKHNLEIGRAQAIANKLGIDHKVIDISEVFNESQSSLLGVGDIPKAGYNEENMKSTVVENRNIIFSSIIYSKALSLANETGLDTDICLGIHSGDHAIYPDCTPESRAMAAELFRISNWNSERVAYIAPFEHNTKADVVKAGIEACKALGLDYTDILGLTHSCYDPGEGDRPCGKCGTCVERQDAFEICGVDDPAM